jgi:hypothetical protein
VVSHGDHQPQCIQVVELGVVSIDDHRPTRKILMPVYRYTVPAPEMEIHEMHGRVVACHVKTKRVKSLRPLPRQRIAIDGHRLPSIVAL